MAKNVKLLLIENVEAVGIVGDVVNVRIGFARNFLLPRNLATQPSDELVKSLAAKRADAEKLVAAQRKQREETTEKLKGIELELVRSCNDQAILYGAITQQDVATALTGKGYTVKPRDVRLPGAIKRIDKYDVHVKLDKDLDAIIKLIVKPDRELPKDATEAPKAPKTDAKAEGEAPAADGAARPERAERPERGDRPERDRGERGDRGDREERGYSRKRADLIEQAIQADKARVVGWGGKKDTAQSTESAADAGEKKSKGKKADGEAKSEAKSEPKAEKAEKKAKK